jgi:hypothetical protein
MLVLRNSALAAGPVCALPKPQVSNARALSHGRLDQSGFAPFAGVASIAEPIKAVL